eukprot:NODE_175_length_15885_cov_0.420563.p10 type:complete len:128 gc:universal NODE_175_length_15885_cov_0.420563:4393-4010(-)
MKLVVLLLCLVSTSPSQARIREVMVDNTVHPKYKRLYQKAMDGVQEHLKYLHKKGFSELGPVADPRIIKRVPKNVPKTNSESVDFNDPSMRMQFDDYMLDFALEMAHDIVHSIYEDMAGTFGNSFRN